MSGLVPEKMPRKDADSSHTDTSYQCAEVASGFGKAYVRGKPVVGILVRHHMIFGIAVFVAMAKRRHNGKDMTVLKSGIELYSLSGLKADAWS